MSAKTDGHTKKRHTDNSWGRGEQKLREALAREEWSACKRERSEGGLQRGEEVLTDGRNFGDCDDNLFPRDRVGNGCHEGAKNNRALRCFITPDTMTEELYLCM